MLPGLQGMIGHLHGRNFHRILEQTQLVAAGGFRGQMFQDESEEFRPARPAAILQRGWIYHFFSRGAAGSGGAPGGISYFVPGMVHGFHAIGGNRIRFTLVSGGSGLRLEGLAGHDAQQAKKLKKDPDAAGREFHGVWRDGIPVE